MSAYTEAIDASLLAWAKRVQVARNKTLIEEGRMGLPTDDKARKALPIFTGFLMYFPDACAAVAEVSRIGNDQHNPGEPLHWAREKSTDQLNTAQRHMIDHGRGNIKDTDGSYHLAKAIWRLSAELQLTIEREAAKSDSAALNCPSVCSCGCGLRCTRDVGHSGDHAGEDQNCRWSL